MKKRILVACGAGIATSTVVCDRVERLVKENNIDATVTQCKIAEVGSLEDHADLIISTTILPREFKIPAIKATAYISGIGTDKLDEKILSYLR
ncbi:MULTISPECIES: PTS sugar transporter subunit IIB [Clostridium]|jgi:Phosphotransferase system, galactitol-specific IIB component|uniref:PTS sugar transporter subunit IIB n=3 Tax=Clostridium TaxID=1485 RepID=A0A1B9BP74_CLOBE|nr:MULTISPECIES: PTS sugar transporter subunit IIB [Clostridium]ABR32411.1 phosphotransferase system, lactose/cellobiose-specific IIB subunit [Clostridium beijerinckii NCIMB 8052]AIU03147.1 phosphotransferase system, lactose/cellobiose-specific IIB subunit [Clostridium beijerinckii ATCC 35702]AVK49271.1 PTS galactitol transporter subunit IIB [Clostridium sp. MF28]MBA8936035.1 PTS system galactitol-specific IIB component [Clostridium beijerinckii]MBE6087600.1 PTS galactitol transporter subunit 